MYNSSATVPTSAGSYTVIGTINDANYSGSATNTLVIDKAVLTVAADNKSKLCGMPNPPLTANYSGFVNGENTNMLTSPATLNTTATTNCGAGTYPITVGGAAAANYRFNFVDGMLTVGLALQLNSTCVNVNGDNQFIIRWPTIAGMTYQLEYRYDLDADDWTPLGGAIVGTGDSVSVTNSASGNPHCFFRVGVQ
jgi:hypothetical protein